MCMCARGSQWKDGWSNWGVTMGQENLVPKTQENPDQALLWEAACMLLGLGREWMAMGAVHHRFFWGPAWVALEMLLLGTLVMVGILPGSSVGNVWGSITTAFLAPGLPCECMWRHRAKCQVTSTSQAHCPRGPHLFIFLRSPRHHSLLSSSPAISLAGSPPVPPSQQNCSLCVFLRAPLQLWFLFCF